jgi:copper(I)-binding protein
MQAVPSSHAPPVSLTFTRMPRRRFLCTALAAGTPAMAPGVRACEFQTGWLRVTHPWTRATVEGAHTAVLCMRIDEVMQDDRLIGASSPVATGAEMAGPAAGQPIDLPLPTGSTLEMHEDGLHLRLTGLRHPLQAGREYPLTLEFERSGLLLARLSVDFTAMRFR